MWCAPRPTGGLLALTACQISPLYYPGNVPARNPDGTDTTDTDGTDTDGTDTEDTDTTDTDATDTDTTATGHTGGWDGRTIVTLYGAGTNDTNLPCGTGDPADLRPIAFQSAWGNPFPVTLRQDDCTEIPVFTMDPYAYSLQSLNYGGVYVVRSFGIAIASVVVGSDFVVATIP